MRRRQVPRDVVEAILAEPQQVVPGRPGKSVYQSQVDLGTGKTYLVRVVVADAHDPPLVVTVYRTSKTGKYWRQS